RCVGKYVYEMGLTGSERLTLETLGGIKTLHLHVKEGVVGSVTVDMGLPILTPSEIPMLSRDPKIKIAEKEIINGREYNITGVSMGNPHAVIFVDEITDEQVLTEGPLLECADIFPRKANIEFARIIDRNNIAMRVWERGTGETWACGTGACATAVAAILNGLTERSVTVHLRGGDLHIEWENENSGVNMTGPAEWICEGIFYRNKIEER
ncbi:MAG: diaminopimelate epimerase, partial [Muribaculaceae bacterium]|nr:diaminopimelate epimerase [Muribaculaceae bacterium]